MQVSIPAFIALKRSYQAKSQRDKNDKFTFHGVFKLQVTLVFAMICNATKKIILIINKRMSHILNLPASEAKFAFKEIKLVLNSFAFLSCGW